MNLEIWGLGYAGLVCAAGLAHRGHRVVGVDIDGEKVARLNAGETYFREPGLASRVASTVAQGRLRAVTPGQRERNEADATILCLSTPTGADGQLSTQHLLDAANHIAERLRKSARFETIIVRSTVPVHFTRRVLRPLLESRAGRIAGRDFGLAMVPEFLREGQALVDFDRPSLIVVGADDDASAAVLGPLFDSRGTPTHVVSTATAELFKLSNNAFHALKIAFANEAARLAHAQGIDGHAILELLCEDKLLNISSAYLRPGFAYGGACLGKDLAALQALGRVSGAPILEAIARSNLEHLDACVLAIKSRHFQRLGLFGITTKAGSDDLRNSPVLALLDRLQAAPGTIFICDPDLSDAQAQSLQSAYGVQTVANLDALQIEVDLIVNFRNAPLALPARFPQIHFAAHWQGGSLG